MVTEVACGNNSSGPEWTAGARRVNMKILKAVYTENKCPNLGDILLE